MTIGMTSEEKGEIPRKVVSHDLPPEIRNLFTPEMFSLTLRALTDFKMPPAKAAKELADFCNLTLMNFLTNTSRAVDFTLQNVPHPRNQTWMVVADRTSKVSLPDNFRGRVICTGINKKP